MAEKRINYFDYAKGFAILCVLLGHMNIHPLLKSCIYSFHMPLFFLISGCFLKCIPLNKSIVAKNFKAIMLPYFIVGGGMCLWQLFSDYEAFINLETSSLASLLCVGYRNNGIYIVNFVGAIWFLWVLFFSKLYTQQMLNFKYGGLYICIFAAISICFTKLSHIVPPFGLLQSLTASVFLLIGFWMKEKDLLNFKLSKKALYFLIILAVILMFKGSVAMRQNGFPFNLLSCFVSSYISIMIIKGFQLFDKLEFFCVKQVKSFLLFCGRNSLAFLCVHTIEGRYHWLSLDTHLVGLEFIIRVFYILLIIKILSYFPLTKRILNVK